MFWSIWFWKPHEKNRPKVEDTIYSAIANLDGAMSSDEIEVHSKAIMAAAEAQVLDNLLQTIDDETLAVAKHGDIAPHIKGNYTAVQGNRLRLNLILHDYARKRGLILKTPRIQSKGKKKNV